MIYDTALQPGGPGRCRTPLIEGERAKAPFAIRGVGGDLCCVSGGRAPNSRGAWAKVGRRRLAPRARPPDSSRPRRCREVGLSGRDDHLRALRAGMDRRKRGSGGGRPRGIGDGFVRCGQYRMGRGFSNPAAGDRDFRRCRAGGGRFREYRTNRSGGVLEGPRGCPRGHGTWGCPRGCGTWDCPRGFESWSCPRGFESWDCPRGFE